MPHPYMAFDIKECEKFSLIPDKNTTIIATCQSSMDVFMMSVFSLLLRTNPQKLEHFMICINGPDTRCGDPSNQDTKQKFVEELRNLKWHNRDMPISVIRVWSRIGHSHSMEMAIPWIHTEFYTIMHDDVIITNNKWLDNSLEALVNPKAVLSYLPPLLCIGMGKKVVNGKWFLELPHLNSALVVCKKPIMQDIGHRWCGYHFEHPFRLYDQVNIQEFMDFHYKRNNVQSFPVIEQPYNGISMDIGSWIYNEILQKGYEVMPMPENTALHLTGFSWREDSYKKEKFAEHRTILNVLYEELKKHEAFFALYEKYKNA